MNATRSRPLHGKRRHDGCQRPLAYTSSETVLLFAAAVAFTDGLIHVGAAVDHFDEFPLYTFAFVAIAVVQFGWAAMLLKRPTRPVLLWGCAFSASVIALWVASRTVGVPIAPRPWEPESVGVADLTATVGELTAVLAALSVALSPGLPLAQRVRDRLTPLLLGVLLASVLYGVSAHAG